MTKKISEASLLSRGHKLLRTINYSYVELAEVFYHLRNTVHFSCDAIASEFAMSKRKVYDFIGIYQMILDGNFTKADAVDMGWSRALHMRGMMDQGTSPEAAVTFLLNRGRTTVNLRRDKANLKEAPTARGTTIYSFTRDQQDIVNAALKDFGMKKSGRGFTGREEALVELVKEAARAGLLSEDATRLALGRPSKPRVKVKATVETRLYS